MALGLALKRTLMQFGGEAEQAVPEVEEPRATRCPSCSHHFSGDARFCPFDGSALEAAPDWDPSGDPLIGSVVDGRYEVEDVLGEGGMGTVYRARHRALGRRFAMKALRRELSQDGELAARFIQEAKAAAAVSHPNVVQITDFGRLESGQPYFVMELLAGKALSRIIREDGALPPLRAAKVARQVAEALAAAHEAGIIHRDLKPDNVHVAEGAGEHELMKVLDFGLAKIAGASRLTRQGMVFGTPHYMSPEQAAGEPIDHRVDIYALGVVLYEMLTGRLPFEADSFMGVLTKHIYMNPVPPSHVLGARAELEPLESITLRCLQKKPSNRYASMAELIADLDRTMAAAASPPPSAPPAEPAGALSGAAVDLGPASIPTRPRWPFAVAGATGIAVLVALVGWSLSGGSSGVAATDSSAARPPPAPEPPPSPPPESAAVSAPPVAPVAPASASSVPPRPPAPRTAAPPPARSAPRPAPRPAPSRTGKVGSGEIINPWAE